MRHQIPVSRNNFHLVCLFFSLFSSSPFEITLFVCLLSWWLSIAMCSAFFCRASNLYVSMGSLSLPQNAFFNAVLCYIPSYFPVFYGDSFFVLKFSFEISKRITIHNCCIQLYDVQHFLLLTQRSPSLLTLLIRL